MPIEGFNDWYRLPPDVRAAYTQEQWAWLSDQEKSRIMSGDDLLDDEQTEDWAQ